MSENRCYQCGATLTALEIDEHVDLCEACASPELAEEEYDLAEYWMEWS